MLQITGVCYIYIIENLNISNHVLGTFALYVETSLLLFAFFLYWNQRCWEFLFVTLVLKVEKLS